MTGSPIRTIISNRRLDLSDMLNITDRVDDKYLLFIRCSDRVMYLSKKYEAYEEALLGLGLEGRRIQTVDLDDTRFTFSTIDRRDYAVSLGYELSSW